jgi:SAM-dependent methyltransferase
MDGDHVPLMYGELAGWFHLLTAPEDYAEEAAVYRRLLDGAGQVRTVLELGSGGGNNAVHLKRSYDLVLTDRSPAMLDVSRTINPDLEHVVGDMCELRLGRTFDAVFVHDAVSYLVDLTALGAMFATAAAHLRSGGVLLVCPDHVRETFAPGTDHGGHDGDGRSLRYLEWTHPADPGATTCTATYVFVLREGDDVQVRHEQHELGLFSRDEWLATANAHGFTQARFEPTSFGTEVLVATWSADR